MPQDLHAVLFDLDGTLLDTAPDMIGALNRLRAEHGLDAMTIESLRPSVSHGSARLVRVGFPQREAAELPALQERFLEIYRANLSHGTRLFEGMEGVLDDLQALRVPVGVVTNKPGWLTDPLLEQLGLSSRFACVVSGDTVAQRKPHPLPLLHAAQLAGAIPAQCVYIGDAERDIQSAHAAGMPALVASYGYLGEEDDPDTWMAEGKLARPLDLLPWLRGNGHL